MLLLVVGLVLPTRAQVSGHWEAITSPGVGKYWELKAGKGLAVTAGNRYNPLDEQDGNTLVMGLAGSEAANALTATMVFGDIKNRDGSNRVWLDDTLDRSREGVCRWDVPAPTADAYASGVCLALNSFGNGVCELVGSGLPFGYRPAKQAGLEYSLLYVIESTVNGHWQIVGVPQVIPPVPMHTAIKFRTAITYDIGGNKFGGSVNVGGAEYTASEFVGDVTANGRAGAAWFHMWPQTCIGDGKRAVELSSFALR